MIGAELERPAAVPTAWLTPRAARAAPVHRWFVFPHSFAPELVRWLFDELDVTRCAAILDPFCGAGTTLVEAQRLGHRGFGFDLLPLAVLATNAKTNQPSGLQLKRAGQAAVAAARAAGPRRPPGQLLRRAFGRSAYGQLSAALESASGPAGDCVRVATLGAARRFSRLVADGGWLRESEPELGPRHVPSVLDSALAAMLDDLGPDPGHRVVVNRADARALPVGDGSIDFVVTSPPYPNRHDYTRVFAVELEVGFRLESRVKQLRHRALRSHPEAQAAGYLSGYAEDIEVARAISEVWRQHPDHRIGRMLSGYFNDLHDVLLELRRVLRPGGKAALVVGNARYCGVEIPVDVWLAALGERVGFLARDVIPLRLRGNSAQQMKTFGRLASRESAVILVRQ